MNIIINLFNNNAFSNSDLSCPSETCWDKSGKSEYYEPLRDFNLSKNNIPSKGIYMYIF